MGWLRDFSRYLGYAINPAGAIIDYFQGVPNHDTGQYDKSGFQKTKEFLSNTWSNVKSGVSDAWSKVKDWAQNTAAPWLEDKWKDLTGENQILLQNQLDREMAEEEYQRNLQSIGDTAAAYEAAGFNRNLLYGSASPASYSAPQLQAYSGSAKLDTMLNRVGKVLSLIPAMYQSTAALEGIDQARERTKQSEIKTMSMGMSLLDQGYKLGDIQLSHRAFMPDLYKDYFSGKRHVNGLNAISLLRSFEPGLYNRYADAALKNKFDLLESIGIKNQMNSTLNSWRGYQYDLDRRFGAAGRIVGMASQGAGAIGKLVTPNMRFFGFK